MTQDFNAGIDIGGTKIACAIASDDGALIERRSLATNPDSSPDILISEVLEMLASLAQQHGGRLAAIGIGCPGPLDLQRGQVLAPPNMPRCWWQFPLRTFVEERMGLTVTVENDANAAALGEHLYGAGRGYPDMVYLTISTGIGGGIIADNRLVHREGEAGHVMVRPDGALCGCGAHGCLEAECSGTSIARRARQALSKGDAASRLRAVKQLTASEVVAAVREGDEVAGEIWRETIELMANGIGSIIALLAPQAVILGGGVAAGAGELLLGPLRAELKQRVRIVNMNSVAVLGAGLGADSGLYGALALRKQNAG